MRRVRVSPTAFRRLVLAAVVSLALIVVTGGAVRLSNSGLGCPTWPRCTAHSYVAPATVHALVEFVNRVVSASVGALVAAVAVAAVLAHRGRRDLVLLAWALVAGFVGQAVIGGLTVLYGLSPSWVMAHFLLSMVLLWAALLLLHRSDPAPATGPPAARRELRGLVRALSLTAGGVLFLGTVTTGTGPHAGNAHTPRLHFPLERVTQLHADAALLLTGLLAATLVALRVGGAPATVRRHARWLAVAVAAQVAIGYTQYFLDLPAVLVGVHIAAATAVWCLAVQLDLAAHSAVADPVGAPAPAAPPVPRRRDRDGRALPAQTS